jgi:hypothetical protein
MVRTLIQELKRQVLGNVVLTTHTDYADDPASTIAALAEIPAIVLDGPTTRENRFYSQNAKRSDEAEPFGLGSGFFAEVTPPHTVDILFTIIVVTDNPIQSANLQKEMMSFVDRNSFIEMRRDGADPTSEMLKWEFDFEPAGDFSTVGIVNNANVRAFQGQVVIRGFDIDDAEHLVRVTRELLDVPTASVNEPDGVTLSEEQTGAIYQIGPSPGPGGDC